MTALIMWTLILTSVFITITYFIYINILNEHVHMLGKKTGVLFTISSVNFELKQGIEYRSLQLLRILRLSPSVRPSVPLPPPPPPPSSPPNIMLHCLKLKWKLHLYIYSAKKKIIISVASNLSFFTFNTKNNTNILHINKIYQPVEHFVIISAKNE